MEDSGNDDENENESKSEDLWADISDIESNDSDDDDNNEMCDINPVPSKRKKRSSVVDDSQDTDDMEVDTSFVDFSLRKCVFVFYV